MGGINFDPATHAIPQKWIQADDFCTVEDNGLAVQWHGRVFLNPPYGKTGNRSNQEIWAAKLLAEIKDGYVVQAVLLTKTVPGYQWWDNLFNGDWPGPVCITQGRLAFISADEQTRGRSKSASSFWYYGPNEKGFARVFGEIGRVIPYG